MSADAPAGGALSRPERAEIIRRVVEMQEALDRIMDVVMPEGLPTECPHPADRVVDESTMDDDGEKYRCTVCGAVSKTPFPTFHKD